MVFLYLPLSIIIKQGFTIGDPKFKVNPTRINVNGAIIVTISLFKALILSLFCESLLTYER